MFHEIRRVRSVCCFCAVLWLLLFKKAAESAFLLEVSVFGRIGIENLCS